ncbi:MAG: glycosyltransferase family 4 protein [Romboutsia sp.]
MKKIVFFIPYGMETPGGAERVTSIIANNLVNRYDYDIKIITFNSTDSFYNLDENIGIISLNIEKSNNFFIRKLQPIKYLGEYRKLIKKLSADLIISFGVEAVIFNIIATFGIKNLKNFSWEHSSFYQPTYKVLNFLKKVFYKKLDKIIVLNKSEEKAFSSFIDENKIFVIPNPLPWNSSNVSKLNNKVIISVGRYQGVKGFEMLIKAFKKIVDRDDEWKLEIYGKDEGEKENLNRLTKELNLEKNVFLNDATKDIKEKYLNATLYAMSSRYESFGMVLLEAKECGLPIVSFDCMSGPRDIIRDGVDGYLAKYLDVQDLYTKMWKVLSDEELKNKFAINAKKNVEIYNINNIINEWTHIIDSINEEN